MGNLQVAVNLNAFFPPEVLASFTHAQIQNAIYGCKWSFVTEICKVSMIWLCKACVLILYSHMT